MLTRRHPAHGKIVWSLGEQVGWQDNNIGTVGGHALKGSEGQGGASLTVMHRQIPGFTENVNSSGVAPRF